MSPIVKWITGLIVVLLIAFISFLFGQNAASDKVQTNVTAEVTRAYRLTDATEAERQDLGFSGSEYTVRIYQRNADFLLGQVSQKTDELGGPSNPFYAKWTDGHWKRIWTGPEISCAAVDTYQIPVNFYDTCYEDDLKTLRQGTFNYRPYYIR